MGRAKSYVMSRMGAAAFLGLLVLVALPSAASATLVSARNGNLTAFSGGVSTTGGALQPSFAGGPADGFITKVRLRDSPLIPTFDSSTEDHLSAPFHILYLDVRPGAI